MTRPRDDYQRLVQREVDAEINLVNQFLSEIDRRRHHMRHFVSGLHVAVSSVLSAAHTIKKKYPQEGKNSVQEEEGTTTKPCAKEVGETSKEEEQMDDTMSEDEAPEDNLSNELMESLNSTLGDLEQAEDKMIEMNSQSSESCYMDFMYQFLANFRQNLQQSCEEFMSMESQTLALIEERRALQDLSLRIANSPNKTEKPKDVDPVCQKAESEDGAISKRKFTLSKDTNQKSISSDIVAARKEDTSYDSAPFKTTTIVKQKHEDKGTTPTDTSGTSPNTHRNIRKTNDKDVVFNKMLPSKNICTKATSASPTTERSPCDKKESPKEIVTDEVYDGPSPVGLTRMFGSHSQEPKIELPPPSPSAFYESPYSISTNGNSLAMKLNLEVSPSDTDDQKDIDSSDTTPSETRPNIPQKDKDSAPTDISTTAGKNNIMDNTSPKTHRNVKQRKATSNKALPPRTTTASPITETTPFDEKESCEQIVTDEVYDGPSPVGMTMMFGSHHQESKISFPPPSPYRMENSPIRSQLNLEVSPVSVESES